VRIAAALRHEGLAYVEAAVSAWPGESGSRLRRWYYGRRLGALGPRARIGAHALLIGPRRIRIGPDLTMWRDCVLAACDDGEIAIGRGVGLNRGAYLNACQGGRISIGDDVIIGPYSVLRTSDHRFDDPSVPIVLQGHRPGTIVVEPDVWIASHVTVLGDVRIGHGSVVAAGAVVTADVEPLTVVGGVPARPIKRRGASVASGREG
jgi:galactoside O-acetyltransferase